MLLQPNVICVLCTPSQILVRLTFMINLYTIGYEGTDLQFFIRCLTENHVALLIDVRDFPGSRKRGFSKKSLAAGLANAGIAYEHWRQLGAPKEIRYELRQTRDWSKYVEAYSRVLDVQEPMLTSLAARAHEDNTCLMCFERDYKECHRSLVTERLQDLTLTGQAVHLVPKTVSLAAAA